MDVCAEIGAIEAFDAALYMIMLLQPCSSDILIFLSLVAGTLRTFGVLMLLAKVLRDRKVTGKTTASVFGRHRDRAGNHESSASAGLRGRRYLASDAGALRIRVPH